MSVMNVFSLLGGLSLFLFGMKIMGEGLERTAGNRLKNILNIVTTTVCWRCWRAWASRR